MTAIIIMHCSDFRCDDRRIDVLGKYVPSDDQCVRAAGYGTTRKFSLLQQLRQLSEVS